LQLAINFKNCCYPHPDVGGSPAPALFLALLQVVHLAGTSAQHANAPELAPASAAEQQRALLQLLNHLFAVFAGWLGSCCHADVALAAAAVRQKQCCAQEMLPRLSWVLVVGLL
jgi:hypothetical protein